MTIESIMIFALGFLAAALAALAVTGAVWRRAVRLTTKRVQAMVPLSMAEIKAEKDHVRAESAIVVRAMELKMEAAKASANDKILELARQLEAIRDLKDVIASKEAEIARREGVETGLARDLAAARATIAARDETISGDRAIIARAEADLAALDKELAAKSVESDGWRVEIVALKTEGENLRNQNATQAKAIEALKGDLSGIRLAYGEATAALTAERLHAAGIEAERARLADKLAAEEARSLALSAELTAKQKALADQTDTMTEEAKARKALEKSLAKTEQTLAKFHGEVERLGAELQASADARKTAEARADTETKARDTVEKALAKAEKRLARLSADHEALTASTSTETARLGSELESLRAERNLMDGHLRRARSECEKLQRRLAAIDRAGDGTTSAARLRDKLSQFAAEIAHQVSISEGQGSQVDVFLAAEDEAAKRGETRLSPLADRIRALREADDKRVR